MEERDTDGPDSPESSREISPSSSEQLGSITKKESSKRKRFIVARDLAIDPGLELGEELVMPNLSETSTVSDRDTDDDNSGNYQKVRITLKKGIRKRQKVTPTTCRGENTSSDAESSKSNDNASYRN